MIYFLREGECSVRKNIQYIRASNMSKQDIDSIENKGLAMLKNQTAKKECTVHSIAFCQIQKGATIGEECLMPESKYFYTITVKSASAVFLALRKTTSFNELQSLQLITHLQKKFIVKK